MPRKVIPKRPSKRRQSKKATEKVLPPDDAVEAWRSLPEGEQWALLRELVRTRGDELRRAYPSLDSIAYGWGMSRAAKSRFKKKGLCITFFVAKKWSKKKKIGAKLQVSRLPGFLLSYWTISAERVLCAVPTDIEGRNTYKLKAHGSVAQIAARADSLGVGGIKGAIAATVTVPGNESSRYVIGCHHVFGVVPGDYPRDSYIYPLSGATGRIAHVEHLGWLTDPNSGADDSVDVGLAHLTDDNVALLDPSFRGFSFSSFLQEDADSPTNAYVHAPGEGRVVPIELIRYFPGFQGIVYSANGRNFVPRHKVVIEAQVSDNSGLEFGLEAGDSGSPVTDSTGEIFLGMYIGGGDVTIVEDGRSYNRVAAIYIPAYEVLRISNYPGLGGDSDMLQLVPAP